MCMDMVTVYGGMGRAPGGVRSRKLAYVFIMVCLILSVSEGRAAAQGDMVFWNLENFFDYFDDGKSPSDSEFSPLGARRWTKRRFTEKCAMVGKALLWIGENCCSDGEPPAIVGVAEVENAFVLSRIVNSPVLRKLDYGYVHYDSPDRRGIDVALLYRRDRLRILSSRPVHVFSDDGRILPVRDILHVHAEFIPDAEVSASGGELHGSFRETADGLPGSPPQIHLLVNHHPSKFSGERASRRGRELAMAALRDVCDSIARVSDAPIVAMGDFNDTPDGPQFSLIEGVMHNLAEPPAARGEGSIRYDGRWELIDHFLVGNLPCRGGFPENAPGEEGAEGFPVFEMSVVHVPFLMTEDKAHTGFKPLRTYSGPRWMGGVSDHCPILLRFVIH